MAKEYNLLMYSLAQKTLGLINLGCNNMYSSNNKNIFAVPVLFNCLYY